MAEQRERTLNGTQTAITTGTFEQQWGLDATGNWKTFKQDNDGNGTWELNQTRTANKVNEITGVTNSVGTAWATPTYDGAGNMIGMPNPPATTTGTTPAWVPMTEAQWNTLTEAQWNTFTENTGTTAQAVSAQYDAWNRLVLITSGTQKVIEHGHDARVVKSPPTYPPTNARNLHPGNALSKPGKRRNPGFSGVSVSIRNAKGYLYELRSRRLCVRPTRRLCFPEIESFPEQRAIQKLPHQSRQQFADFEIKFLQAWYNDQQVYGEPRKKRHKNLGQIWGSTGNAGPMVVHCFLNVTSA